MSDKLTETAPKRIWLQVDTDAIADIRDEPFPADFDGVTWHDEQIGGLEVEYIRADLVNGIISTAARLTMTSDGRGYFNSGQHCEDFRRALSRLMTANAPHKPSAEGASA